VLAPRSCGQDELLQAYLGQRCGTILLSVYAVDDAGQCLLLEQRQQELSSQQKGSIGPIVPEHLSAGSEVPPAKPDEREAAGTKPAGSKAPCTPAASTVPQYEEQVVLIAAVPWLEDEAAQRFSDHIDSLLDEGHTVFVCCAPQNDRYQNLQSDRMEISALELKQSGLLAPGAYTAAFKQFMTEFLPLQVRLAAALTAVLGQTNLEELERLKYVLAPDLPVLLEGLNPLFAATQSGLGMRAEPLHIPQLQEELCEVIGEYLEEQGQQRSVSSLASRITALSMASLEKNDLEASHQLLEMAEELIGRGVGREAQHSFATTPQRGFSDRSETQQDTVHGSAGPLHKPELPPLYLRLFGKLELRFEGALATDRSRANAYLSRTKIRRLLVYLAFNQQRAVSRDNLIDYLWPHLDPDRAQKNLYTSWCMLAKGLGAEKVRSCPYIRRNGELYQLDSELVSCDIQQFEELARAVLFGNAQLNVQVENLLHMEALYRNSLVADLPADGCITAKMDGYRSMMVDSLLLITRQLRSAGEVEKALFCARAAYELDESREDVYRELMDTQLGAGQRTSALQTYFSCKRFLSDELGILPSKSTTALYQDVLLDNCR
jgi:DNA-binding SARP family transcriptional activator